MIGLAAVKHWRQWERALKGLPWAFAFRWRLESWLAGRWRRLPTRCRLTTAACRLCSQRPRTPVAPRPLFECRHLGTAVDAASRPALGEVWPCGLKWNRGRRMRSAERWRSARSAGGDQRAFKWRWEVSNPAWRCTGLRPYPTGEVGNGAGELLGGVPEGARRISVAFQSRSSRIGSSVAVAPGAAASAKAAPLALARPPSTPQTAYDVGQRKPTRSRAMSASTDQTPDQTPPFQERGHRADPRPRGWPA